MIKILNSEPIGYSDKARGVLQTIGELHEADLDRDGLLSTIEIFDILIIRLGLLIDREILDAATRLKFIVSATTGLDHIDLKYASSQDVEILSLKGETEFLRSIPATAEHTWALLLALLRQIPAALASIHHGVWNRDLFRGNELYRKNLGIIGMGRVGEQVSRFGQAFQMNVGAFDPYNQKWPTKIRRYSSLKELLERSDVISVHVPLNDETNRLLSYNELRLAKRGCILVNTSRGAVIDESALLEGLNSGLLGGAALDVITDEITATPGLSHPLVEYSKVHRNLILTPHLSGATHESMERTEIFMAEKLKTSLEHRSFTNTKTRTK